MNGHLATTPHDGSPLHLNLPERRRPSTAPLTPVSMPLPPTRRHTVSNPRIRLYIGPMTTEPLPPRLGAYAYTPVTPSSTLLSSSQASSSQLSSSATLAPPIELVSPHGQTEFFSSWRGRKMRTPGPLPWPCDPLELERVQAQHWLLRLLLGYPYIGPMAEVLKSAGEEGRRGRVLDIATGTGIWATDVGDMFPGADVIGVDNAPIQETETWQNVDWDLADLEALPYEQEDFDVVHVRFAKLRVRSYSSLLRQAYSLVRPGGVLLIFDAAAPPTLFDGRSPTGTQAWTDAFHRSLNAAGMKPFSVDEVVRTFRNGELIGSDMRVPIGHGTGRMGQLGKIHVVNTKAYLEAGRYVMTEHGGYTDSEVDVLTAAYLQDVSEHALYTRYHAFSVRKPA